MTNQPNRRPYEYLSTYEDNEIKHKIINDQTSSDYCTGGQQQQQQQRQQQLANYRDRRVKRRLVAYDPIEHRKSFSGRGYMAECHCNVCNEQLNVKRFTNPSYERAGQVSDVIHHTHKGEGKIVMHRMEACVAEEKGGGGDDSSGSREHQENIEKSYVFLNEMSSDLGTSHVRIDVNDPQAPLVTSRQSRVSFSSKDSRTCLLSQNDTC